jgi:hypothetical protein
MKKDLIINKGRGRLYSKFLVRLYEAWKGIPEKSRKDYLPYSEFTTKIPRSFQINKYDAREILLILEDLEYVSILKRGIKLNYEVVEDE